MAVSKRRTGRTGMRLLHLEIRRMLSTNRIRILLVLSVFFSMLMAYLPVTFESISYAEETGSIVDLKGIEAIKYKKNLQKEITGVVTDEKVRTAVEEYQNILREYDVRDYYELSDEVYVKRVFPFIPLVKGVREVFADSSTGMAPNIMEIDTKEINDYYSKCEEWIASLMKIEQKDNHLAQDFAIRKYHDIEKPYMFYPGTSRNAIDYQVLLALVILIFCIMIAAPMFSSDYQTGADDIFRTTRKGGICFGSIKLFSVLLICSSLYLVCMMLYLIISNSLFGWECTKTSVQMLYSIVNLVHFNIGELQITIVFAGMLSILATISVTLFFSSRSRNVIVSLALGFVLCIAPLFVSMMFPDRIELWLSCILPSGGVGMQTSFLYQLIDFQFLNIGGWVIWVPYAMIGFAFIEIPLFLGEAIYSYLNYQVS